MRKCDYVAYIKGTYVNIEVNNNSSLEAYDKEWELKDEGERERNVEIPKSMLQEKIPIEIISKCTSLSTKEINDLNSNT